jgi:hypothetical protein
VWKNRWVRVGLVALAIFLVNAVSRLVSLITHRSDTTTGVNLISLVGAAAVVVLVALAAAYWAVRYPFARIFFDLGSAAVVGALLSLIIGPLVGGNAPFKEGLGTFVGEFLQFLGLAAIGGFFGFVTMIVLGKDWKSRGYRAYEQKYQQKRPHRTVR